MECSRCRPTDHSKAEFVVRNYRNFKQFTGYCRKHLSLYKNAGEVGVCDSCGKEEQLDYLAPKFQKPHTAYLVVCKICATVAIMAGYDNANYPVCQILTISEFNSIKGYNSCGESEEHKDE